MSKIKAYTSYNENTKERYFRNFEIVDELPICDEVKAVSLDVEQGRPEVTDYNYFECIFRNADGETYEYFAISKFADKEISIQSYPANIEISVSEMNHLTDEMETKNFTMDTDGLEFEDEDELDDYIDEFISDEIVGWFLLNDTDYGKISDKLRSLLDSKIVEED